MENFLFDVEVEYLIDLAFGDLYKFTSACNVVTADK